jgi:hypothetical protein
LLRRGGTCQNDLARTKATTPECSSPTENISGVIERITPSNEKMLLHPAEWLGREKLFEREWAAIRIFVDGMNA